jgi:hypothetical protein
VSAATATGASANGLLLYYPFDTGSTNSSVTLDRSGRGNTGTQTNFLGLTTGKIGQAIQFDGATRYVTASNVASLQLTTLTASIWVKTSGAGRGLSGNISKISCLGDVFWGRVCQITYLVSITSPPQLLRVPVQVRQMTDCGITMHAHSKAE